MEKIYFKHAYYLKLGRQGLWEDDLKDGRKARIGWSDIDIEDILKENWDKIKGEIEEDYKIRGKKTGATQDFNALQIFCKATDEDVFITFHYGKLYWCILDNSDVLQDEISKFRTTKIRWCSTDIKGKSLEISHISGMITKTQGFRGTLCKIEELDTLSRIINSEKKPIVEKIEKAKLDLCKFLNAALIELHPYDFEVLVDLIFQQSGWRRVSKVGGNMKDFDLELEDPISKERYKVQVKVSAGLADLKSYAEDFDGADFHKLFFVVSKPDKTLAVYNNEFENVQLLTGLGLAELIIDLGLTNWVLQKIF